MLEIYPKVGEGKGYICPVCKCQLSQPSRVAFKLSAVLAYIECTCCEEEYYQTLPPEFSQQPRLSFLKKYGKIRYESAEESEALKLLDEIQKETLVSLEVRKRKDASHVLWLNCFFEDEQQIVEKLVAAQLNLFRQVDLGLVVVIREELAYLVPEAVSEVWFVRMNDGNVFSFNDLVSAELNRFARVFVPSLADSQVDGSISWEGIFKVKPFFKNSRLIQDQSIITFYCHPDRFWLSSKWEQWLFNKAMQWDLLDVVKPYLERRQLRKFKLLAERVHAQHKVTCHLIGIGKAKPPTLFKDERLAEEKIGAYQRWIPLLAASEVVLGVFGDKLSGRVLSGQSLSLGSEDNSGSFLLLPQETSMGHFPEIKEVSDCLLSVLRKYSVDSTK